MERRTLLGALAVLACTLVPAAAAMAQSFPDRPIRLIVPYAPGGAMSEYLAQRCTVGDRLDLTGPMGSFFLRESPRPLLLLAGGTGLAPVLSILESLAVAGSGETGVLRDRD